MKRIPLAALAALAACSQLVSDEPLPNGIALEFAFQDDMRQYLAPEPQAEAAVLADGTVRIETRTTEPRGCLDFEAELDGSGNTVEVAVSVVPTRTLKSCAPGMANFTWTARLVGLPPGTYRLRVRHLYLGVGRDSRVVLTETITVP